MQCPNCQRENRSGALFCIFCGAPMPSESKPPLAPRSAQIPTQGVPTLGEEVHQLRELLTIINNRLAAVERRLDITVPAPEPRAAPPTREIPESVPAAATAPDIEVMPGPVAEIAPAPAVPFPAPPPAAPRQPREWEQILGGNWLARIGVIALFIGIAFFVKFAIDVNNEWLGPTIRIVLVIIIGLIMIGAGYYWRKRYVTFSQALDGGGIGVLYLGIFAAFAYFQILNFYLAVALLFIISGGSAALALRQNSMALAIIGILGAFLAPFLLGAFEPVRAGGPAAGTGFQILVYVMVVDLGVIALSTFRNWRWFTLLALFGSVLAFSAWQGQYSKTATLLVSQGSLTILFLIFVGATMLYHIVWRRTPRPFDYALMLINAAVYFGMSYGLMWTHLREWMGGFSLLIALFYGGLAYAAIRRGAGDTRLGFFALGIALIFLTIAVPVQLGNRAWTTIAWAAEGTVLMWLAIRFRIIQFRYESYAVFAATAIRLLFFDTFVNHRTFYPVVNERVLAFVFSIAALYLTGYLLWREKGDAGETKAYGYSYPVFLVAANLFTLWLIGAEIITYTSRPLVHSILPPILLIVLAGATTLYRLIWRRPPGTSDLVLIALNAAFYLGISTPLWHNFRAWMGGIYLVLAIFYGALAYFALRRNTRKDVFGLVALGIALAFVTLAIPVQFRDRAGTTIAWAVELVVFIWLSSRLRVRLFYFCGYGVLALMVGRLLSFDATVNVRTFTPVLNERFLAFCIGIAAVYLTAYLLRRERNTLPGWRTPFITLIVVANVLTVLLFSLELWDYFGSLLIALKAGRYTGPSLNNLRNVQNLSLTAVWAIYAVILLVIGIRKRLRLLRIGALALLLVTIIKVFTYDVWHLQVIYRIIALVGLGVLLLASGYLYQRYSRTIRGFLVKE